MIDFIKYFKFYFIWLTLFIIYYIFLHRFNLVINYPIMYSAYMSIWISTFIDIVKKEGGHPSIYKYDEKTNQKIRYLIFILATGFVVVGHHDLLCDKLKIFTC